MPDEHEAKLLDKVRGWMHNQGYALEYEAARRFNEAGFISRQGQTHVDLNTTKTRDIDVVAELPPEEPRSTNQLPRFFAVIECKTVPEPWLVRKAEMYGDQLAWEPIATRAIIDAVAHGKRQFPYLRPPNPTGFDVVQVNPTAKGAHLEAPFATVAQVVSAARGVLKASEPAFVLPVIILGNEVVELSYDTNGNERLASSQWERVLWFGLNEMSVPTVVDIVTRQFVANYARSLWAELDNLRDDLPPGRNYRTVARVC